MAGTDGQCVLEGCFPKNGSYQGGVPFIDFVFRIKHPASLFSDVISCGIYSNYTCEETLIRKKALKLRRTAQLVNGRGIVTLDLKAASCGSSQWGRETG